MFLEWENNSGKLQIISGKFQNNANNDVKQISPSHVTKGEIKGIFHLLKGSQLPEIVSDLGVHLYANLSKLI